MPALRQVQESYWLEDGCALHRHGGVTDVLYPWGASMGAWRLQAGTRVAWTPRFLVANLETRLQRKQFAAPEEEASLRFLLEAWPAAVKDAIRPLPEQHWQVLCQANRYGGFYLDLLRSNPALAMLNTPRNPDAVANLPADLFQRKRRELAGLCGLTPAESTVRILARMPVASVMRTNVMLFHRVLGEVAGPHDWVRHLPVLTGPVLRLLGSGVRRLITYRLALSVAACGERSEAWAMFDRLSELEDLVAQVRATRVRIDSPDQIPELVQRLRLRALELADVARLSGGAAGGAGAQDFPPPPLPETAQIRAIRSAPMLKSEGRAMRHCCGAYVDRVVRGNAYFYHMTWPERATICIQRSGRQWRLEQAKGFANRVLKRHTINLIEMWIVEGTRPHNVEMQPRRLHRPYGQAPGSEPRQASFFDNA